jgi:hypothetical protein
MRKAKVRQAQEIFQTFMEIKELDIKLDLLREQEQKILQRKKERYSLRRIWKVIVKKFNRIVYRIRKD